MRLRSLSRRKLAGMALGLAVVVGYLVAVLMVATPPVILPVPSPNGYDDLVRASEATARTTPPRFAPQFAQIVPLSAGPDMNKYGQAPGIWEPVPAYLGANREAFAWLRVGLDRESVVPVAYRPGYFWATRANRDGFKALGELLLWESRLAVHEDRRVDAARSYFDMIRLGRAVSRGGLGEDGWLDQFLQVGGLTGLGYVRDGLTPADCRRMIATLGDLESTAEPLSVFQARDAAYADADQGRLRNMVHSLTVYQAKADQDARAAEAWDETIALSRMVRIELALRACRVESGSEPATLDGLVPKYLPSVHLDPFSGRPPVYRKAGSGHVLYCLGADRVDDGGTPPVRALGTQPKGDLLIDSLTSTIMP